MISESLSKITVNVMNTKIPKIKYTYFWANFLCSYFYRLFTPFIGENSLKFQVVQTPQKSQLLILLYLKPINNKTYLIMYTLNCIVTTFFTFYIHFSHLNTVTGFWLHTNSTCFINYHDHAVCSMEALQSWLFCPSALTLTLFKLLWIPENKQIFEIIFFSCSKT